MMPSALLKIRGAVNSPIHLFTVKASLRLDTKGLFANSPQWLLIRARKYFLTNANVMPVMRPTAIFTANSLLLGKVSFNNKTTSKPTKILQPKEMMLIFMQCYSSSVHITSRI